MTNNTQASQQVPSGMDSRADEIVSQLYRRFKEWSKRGFGPDDVTWCEVKADVIALIAAVPAAIDVRSAAQALSDELEQVIAENGFYAERAMTAKECVEWLRRRALQSPPQTGKEVNDGL